MYELFSNFFLIQQNQFNITNGIIINLSSNNIEKCVELSYKNYIELNTIYIVYKNKEDINYFITIFIEKYSSKKDNIDYIKHLNKLYFI